jgi:hypothetical protein
LDVVQFLYMSLQPGAAELPVGVCQRGAVHWACRSRSLSVVRAVLGRPDVVVNRVVEWGRMGRTTHSARF